MERRIESKTSRTAEYTCFSRAMSYVDKREEYKGDDYVALTIMNSFVKFLTRLPFLRGVLLGQAPKGMYEYVIARTRYIDGEFRKALEDGTEQILFFGAGFDSRAIRFQDVSKSTRIFELESPVTQNAKIARYKEKKIGIPGNLVFVPIDFERECVPGKLAEYGFEKGRRSLFILEGLTMYLEPESVDRTFNIIRELAGNGSRVIFDHIYASVVRKENLYEGESELYERVSKKNEGFRFGIEKGEADKFLSGYGFEPTDVLDSAALQGLFFKNKEGEPAATVNSTHCIVAAIKT